MRNDAVVAAVVVLLPLLSNAHVKKALIPSKVKTPLASVARHPGRRGGSKPFDHLASAQLEVEGLVAVIACEESQPKR
jgi:hypothetical protein